MIQCRIFKYSSNLHRHLEKSLQTQISGSVRFLSHDNQNRHNLNPTIKIHPWYRGRVLNYVNNTNRTNDLVFLNVRNFSITTVTFNDLHSNSSNISEPNENINIGNEAKKLDENLGNKNEITNDNLKFESSSNTSNMENGDCAVVSSVKTEEISSVTENVVETKETFLDFIPEKPTPFQTPYAENAPDMVHYIGDPPFEQLGLNSWWPTGWVQWGMEHIHVGLDMPWLGAILLMTVAMRSLIFPLVVLSQKNAVNMNNHMPITQQMQVKIADARRSGNHMEVQKLQTDMAQYMIKHGISPFRSMVPFLGSVPFFMSMFVGLRGMANLPVESMCTGGLGWFADLTIADPYCILPLVTCSSLYLQFRMGADGLGPGQLGAIGKALMNGLPVIVFLATMNFPAAISFYWCLNNIISIIQARVIRTEYIRGKLGVPKMIKWDKEKLPIKDKPFMDTVREALDDWKVKADMEDRRRFDEEAFKKAGSVRPQKLYKFDPTKSKNAVQKK